MIAAMRLLRPVDDERVRAHFEQACNQYAREKLVNPPLHTKLELDRVVEVLRRASPAPEGPVVDFRAGTGRLTLALAQAGYRVVAVDLSRSSLAILRPASPQWSAPTCCITSTSTSTCRRSTASFDRAGRSSSRSRER